MIPPITSRIPISFQQNLAIFGGISVITDFISIPVHGQSFGSVSLVKDTGWKEINRHTRKPLPKDLVGW